MPKFFLRKHNTITKEEIIQLRDLVAIHYGAATKDAFLDWRISEAADFDIVLLKDKEIVLAVSFYHTSKQLTPFSKRKVVVIHFGMALKHEHYSGNVIWKMGVWYARKKAGIFYPLRKVVGLSSISSPRVYENFIRLFPVYYPNLQGEISNELLTFIQEYASRRNFPLQPDGQSCYSDQSLVRHEVTESWVKYSGARNHQINEFFIQSGVIQYDHGRYFRTGKHMVVCGYRSPFRFDFSIWKKPTKTIRSD